MLWHVYGDQRTTCRTIWVLDSNSGHQTWQQPPLLTEPSHRRVFLNTCGKVGPGTSSDSVSLVWNSELWVGVVYSRTLTPYWWSAGNLKTCRDSSFLDHRQGILFIRHTRLGKWCMISTFWLFIIYLFLTEVSSIIKKKPNQAKKGVSIILCKKYRSGL